MLKTTRLDKSLLTDFVGTLRAAKIRESRKVLPTPAATDSTLPISPQLIERRIFVIRGHKVMLDSDLAELYEVPTKRLNEAVARNRSRFPDDFMVELTDEETDALRSQISTSKGRGGRRYNPYVFTEQGVAMLSSVLRSDRAVQVNIAIVRAFVRLRELSATHADLARKLEDLERKYDQQFAVVFDAIKELIEPLADEPRRQIGFRFR
jgi:hypothetical protein